MIFYLDPALRSYFSSQPPGKIFDEILALRGETFRALENRRTQRITLGNQTYFLKQHYGIGWKEIFKNLLQLRLPILGAKNEWLAIERLKLLNIPTQTILGYGARGKNPARIESFLLTQELPVEQSLEQVCAQWDIQPPTFTFKKELLQQLAHIAKTLHTNGINHRDFYLCHFMLKMPSDALKLYLIDLHRAQMRTRTPRRWVLKDLAGLYFSAKAVKLTQRDLLRFIKNYRNQQSLRKILQHEMAFWQKVKHRGDQLYIEHSN